MIMTDTGTQERPGLGDFTRPGSAPTADNAKKTDAERQAEEDALLEKQGMGTDTDEEQETRERISLYEEMQAALVPVTDYKKFLADHKISEEKAARIVDDLMTKGFYEEEYPLSTKYKVTLRTRERRDGIRLQGVLNARMPLLQTGMDELTTRYNLAASLAEYNGKRYNFPQPDTPAKDVEQFFDVRMQVIEKLPDPVFYKLTQKLANFDRMLAAVMREGVAENF
jgi:hypothetical protein